MNKSIEQAIKFKGPAAAEPFDMYVNRQKNSVLHEGAGTKKSAVVGEKFSFLKGNLNRQKRLIDPDRIIQQPFRSNVWEENDLDSILTLVFSDIKTGAQIDMTHTCTPKFKHLWKQMYWDRIKEFLAKDEGVVS